MLNAYIIMKEEDFWYLESNPRPPIWKTASNHQAIKHFKIISQLKELITNFIFKNISFFLSNIRKIDSYLYIFWESSMASFQLDIFSLRPELLLLDHCSPNRYLWSYWQVLCKKKLINQICILMKGFIITSNNTYCKHISAKLCPKFSWSKFTTPTATLYLFSAPA